jgi:hypothetical protein
MPYPPPPRKGVNLWLVVGLPVGAGLLIITLVIVMVAKSTKGYIDYMEKGKRSEAAIHLTEIARRAEQYRIENGSYPTEAAGPTPSLGECCNNGGKCRPNLTQWRDDPLWDSLDISIDTPHYFSLEYVPGPGGSSYTARAFGDLDCDTTYSTFEITSDMPSITKFQPNE